jgi:uncharacterized membrane protein
MTTTVRTRNGSRASEGHAPAVLPGLMVGVGLGGLVDGVIFHQVLQWHHMLTDYGRYASYPRTTVDQLETNTLADGLFHAGTIVVLVIGLLLLWRRMDRRMVPARLLTGLLLAGWGMFNLVEGIVDHHLLTVHHVRDDVDDPLLWDLGYLVMGAGLVLLGWLLARPFRSRSGWETGGDG